MTEQQPPSPRARLQELLAIPESRRTDAEWDEMHELEVKLFSANPAQTLDPGRRNASAAIRPRPGAGAQGKKPFQKGHHKKRPKQNRS